MKTIFFLFVLLLPITFIYSQWEYEGVFPDPNNPNINQTGGIHGLAVDPDGKIWSINYYPYDRDTIYVAAVNQYIPVNAVYVFNADGTQTSFSPIKFLTINGITDTIGGNTTSLNTWEPRTGRGIKMAPDGNIVAAMYDTYYKINYLTGEGIIKATPSPSVVVTAPAFSENGHMFTAAVLPGNPIKEFDENFNFLGDVLFSSIGFSRAFEVSKDGLNLYWAGYTNKCVFKYTRPNISTAFFTYEEMLHGFAAESFAWYPNTDTLWVSAGSGFDLPNMYPGVITNYAFCTWYGYDILSNTITDSIKWENLIDPFWQRPRAIAFSPDGNSAYVGMFGDVIYDGIQKFSAPAPQPVKVISPNGGENWGINTLKEIKWTAYPEIQNVKIEYTSNADTTWDTIVESISANVGGYYWLIPNVQSHYCKVRISDVQDSTVFDVSNNYFTIGRPITETEPNNTPAQANLIEIGDSLDASINPIGDIDYFKFYANTNDTLIIAAYDINYSDLYGRVEISDESGYIWNYLYFYPWDNYHTYFIVPFSGNYYLRVSYAYSEKEYSFISKRDSIEFQKRKKINKKMSETGDYRIYLTEFIPSVPIINFVYSFDTYYNSTVIGVEFYPMGLSTNLTIEYGLSPIYGNSIKIPDTFNGVELYWAVTRLKDLEANSVYYFRVVAENDSGIVYGDGNIFFTPERPEFWTIKSIDSLNYWFWFSDVSFASENTGYMLNSSNNSILKTVDGGDSWTTFYPYYYYMSKIFCLDSITVFALTDNGILKTTNGGAFWSYISITSSEYLIDMYFVDINNGYVIGSSGTILKTTNSGATWFTQPSGTNYPLYSIYFVNTNIGWISGDYGTLLKTTDGGTNWIPQNCGSTNWLNKICFNDSENGYVLCSWEGNVYRTTNGGNSWNSQFVGIYDLRDISFIDADHGVLIGSYEGNILLTTNSGGNWNPQRSGTLNYLNVISKAGNNWVIVGDYGTILKSTYNIVSVEGENSIPASFSLDQNYPNPFNPSTTISYDLPKQSRVVLKIFNILGEEITTLVNEDQNAGRYKVLFNMPSLASGIYIYRIDAGDFTDTKKLILLR